MQGNFKDAMEGVTPSILLLYKSLNYTRVDYRALIRLQPWNTNAMIELLSLIHGAPPEGRPPDDQDAISPKDNPWNVNLKPETDAEIDALYKKLGMTRPKRPKPIPFQRTKMDDIALKILPVDPRSDIPINGVESGVNGDARQSGSSNAVVANEEDGEKEDELDALIAAAKGKLKSGKARGKEKKEDLGRSGLMKSAAPDYGVLYFTWDRYVVRKAD